MVGKNQLPCLQYTWKTCKRFTTLERRGKNPGLRKVKNNLKKIQKTGKSWNQSSALVFATDGSLDLSRSAYSASNDHILVD